MFKRKITTLLAVIAALGLMLSGCSESEQIVVAHTTDEIITASPDVSSITADPLPSDTDITPEASQDETDLSSGGSESTDDTENSESSELTNVTLEEKTEPTTERTVDKTTSATVTTVKTTAPTQAPTEQVTTQKPPLTSTPSPAVVLAPVASGTKTETTSLGVIDYSNTSDGYIMVKYTGSAKKIKVQVKGPNKVTQTYNLNASGNYETFPLPAGNGEYTVLLAENISGTSYAVAANVTFKVKLSSSFAPFLRPNQYANYTKSSTAVKKSSELCGGAANELEKVDAVYSWLVDNVTYDKSLASSVGSGYLPNTNKVIDKKKGICLDYAGAATVMLRSQSVPTKLVVGYAGDAYHAWINVYVENVGWVYGAIYFDGKGWKRMDPTFAASSDSSADIMKYIGDGSNYSEKYIY